MKQIQMKTRNKVSKETMKRKKKTKKKSFLIKKNNEDENEIKYSVINFLTNQKP